MNVPFDPCLAISLESYPARRYGDDVQPALARLLQPQHGLSETRARGLASIAAEHFAPGATTTQESPRRSLWTPVAKAARRLPHLPRASTSERPTRCPGGRTRTQCVWCAPEVGEGGADQGWQEDGHPDPP